jgi:vanillate O-demethylase monooxygenase subunit
MSANAAMTAPSFPSNCWYVAATSDQVGGAPSAHRLLGHDVVLYRQPSGTVVALADRCPHRGYPLSLGRLDGDVLVCGYHGFGYDWTGQCVRIPSQPAVPEGICARAYPVREVPPFIWIWVGEPGSASRRNPPVLPFLFDAAWAYSSESMDVSANYMLLHEHLLDITHHFEVHPHTAPPGIEALPPIDAVEVSETSVSYTRELPPSPLADWEAEATGLPRGLDYRRRQHGTFVSPALHLGRWDIHAGDGRTAILYRVHAFAPAGEGQTRMFTLIARNFQVDRALVTEHLRALFHDLAVADNAVLETIQARTGVAAWRRGARVNADTAALKARRIVKTMLAEEAGRAGSRPGYAPDRSSTVPS